MSSKFIASSACCMGTGGIFHSEILRLMPPQLPSTCAEARSLWGGMCGPCRTCFVHLTRRSCLSEALTKRVASSAAHPHRRAPQAARSESAGTQVAGSPFLGLLSFGEAKESKSAVGPRPDFLPHHKHTAPTGNNKAPIPAFPQRGKEFNTPSPRPSPASGRGSSGRSACATPHASCRTGVPRHKNSDFRRLFERSDAGAK